MINIKLKNYIFLVPFVMLTSGLAAQAQQLNLNAEAKLVTRACLDALKNKRSHPDLLGIYNYTKVKKAYEKPVVKSKVFNKKQYFSVRMIKWGGQPACSGVANNVNRASAKDITDGVLSELKKRGYKKITAKNKFGVALTAYATKDHMITINMSHQTRGGSQFVTMQFGQLP
ncbi:hypothetical protein F9L33_03800 [Amylibacter sp. SFDW26]|uniref:hypothetical protein n=1 Tax=Amylibacter sp. SFDW26 TaxID=2652722 RepID=UPI0012629ED8|nr:hypothetical protein [Amylibacter sp. SFDW26]KAB7615894.1 hypothetical protein F9L33_03800 [Amylibacter sp. SFDW26]